MSKKPSRSQECKKKWYAAGHTIPKCINGGCDRKVTVRHWSAEGHPSLKTECGRCSTARKKGNKVENITFHKKKILSK